MHLHKQSVVFQRQNTHHTLFTELGTVDAVCSPVRLPRVFSNIVLCCVYVPPSADALAAADTIASSVTLPERCDCYGRL